MYRYVVLSLLLLAVACAAIRGGHGPRIAVCGRNCGEMCDYQYEICRNVTFSTACGESGCVCIPNYVRNNSRFCVPCSASET